MKTISMWSPVDHWIHTPVWVFSHHDLNKKTLLQLTGQNLQYEIKIKVNQSTFQSKSQSDVLLA